MGSLSLHSVLGLNQLHYLFGPKTVHLKTPLSTRAQDYKLFVSWLRGALPQLLTLDLSIWRRSRLDQDTLQLLSTDLCDLLISQYRLSKFDSGPIPLPDNAIAHLAGLETLEHLVLRNNASDIVRCVTERETERSFSNLKFMSFRTSSLTTITTIIKISKARLTLLRVTMVKPALPSEKEIQHLFDQLKLSQASDLRSVHIGREGNTTADDSIIRVSFSTFESMLAFPILEEFEILLPLRLELDNDALSRMVEAWPKLISLKLGPGCTPDEDTSLNFRVLSSIVESCPDISALSIILSGTYRTWEEQQLWQDGEYRPANGISCDNWVHLDFGASTFYWDEGDLALYLSDLFPQLESLKAWSHATEGDAVAMKWKRDWEAIFKSVLLLGHARRQERNWAESE